MRVIIRRDYGNTPDVPVRTEDHSSPTKQSASNRQPSQPHTRGHVDNAIQHELAQARFIADDLGDHMFGHLVATDIAKDILKQFIADGVVDIYDSSSETPNKPLGPKSKRVRKALAAAFKDARAHGCIRSDSDAAMAETESVQADKKQGRGKKSKQQDNPYSWRWRDFPREPIGEDKVVTFLNDITDRALEIAKPRLDSNCKVRNRFAAPEDKYHGVPLSYEPDGEDMRPDFLVLPVKAFSPDFKTVDQKYVNFTALRAVGESKNKDFASGLDQVHRYARGIRRAQPWVHFVVALTVTRSRLALVRGDGSGTERLELALSDGRGCIELIRILLGIALAEGDDLGQSSEVELETKERSCKVSKAKAPPPPKEAPPAEGHYRESKATASSSQLYSAPASLSTHDTSQSVLSSSGLAPHISNASVPSSAAVSSNSKRSYCEVDDDDDAGEDERKPSKKANRTELPVVAFIPVAVYGRKCLGILFTTSSIRGRGTAVFCVVDVEDESRLLALKMSWQDVARVGEQNEVLERLEERKSKKTKLQQRDPHANLVVPFESFTASRKNETCTTLGAIRAFLDHQLAAFTVENRVLSVSLSELKRPVKYFWGVHDFVRGVRGALLGHQYLTSIGVLHRDISENNVVLARRPGDERGYLIDFDMAILQEPEKPTEAAATVTIEQDLFDDPGVARASLPIPPDETKPIKAPRTGTIPYMSFNVLHGRRHTHFDDMESFLYVVLLFFFSYAGPLSREELRDADTRGFTQPVGSGRLTHTRVWPPRYAKWADGDTREIAGLKDADLGTEQNVTDILASAEVTHCLQQNWESGLHEGIRVLLLSLWMRFAKSRIAPGLNLSRTEVTHDAFIRILDKWLAKFHETEQEFSNCPFT
ncbi:hypothetical protein PAXINDRAFT_173363 [Paxillus involutus ATCC 200175]|uniref:Unplaced genomic scaffold PAXINscaffold_495, whole genome shotgun sequence n=1 Tax=Paxillus involutus ATCC 200175 TaxID=664439 RepID=A0A0C9T9B7_PAXIN|nr:hypothetical protein PAXINDRAFT_173363 [Paxillus involutus ATCC 200175]